MSISSEKKYEMLVLLYISYHSILLKAAAFVYAIISGLVAFFIANPDSSYINAILGLATFIGIVASIIFLLSLFLLKNVHDEFECLATEESLTAYPAVLPLALFLLLYSLSMIFMVIYGNNYLLPSET